MEVSNIKVYGYRWVVLFVFMLIAVTSQVLWTTYPSITLEAARYYRTPEISIGFLSMILMIVYVPTSILASWVIDTYGLRLSVGIGAGFIGIFGLLRGFTGPSYPLVLAAQVGIALGQPFILNAVTTVAANWFPLRERSLVTGLGTLSIYSGILMGLVVTPFLTSWVQINGMLFTYGIVALATALIFILFARSRPATPPCPPGMEDRSLVLDGFKKILRNRDFILLMIIYFIGLGVLNALTTWIEIILVPRGYSSTQAGTVGGLLFLGGILGTLVVPVLSGRYRKQVPFIVMAETGAFIGLLGFTYATNYWILIGASVILGFFLLGAGSVSIQYSAEITHPTSEGTSNGLLIMMGQISGIVFVYGMDVLKSPHTGSMILPLVILIVLMAVNVLLSAKLREPEKLPL